MQFKPQPWTHHHTHRLYHMSVGFCFMFAALAMVGTMTTVWLSAAADDVQVTATVSGITPGPTTGGGSSGSIPHQNPTANPTITIVAEPLGYIQTRGTSYVFPTPRPRFSGQSSVPNGLIFITIKQSGSGEVVINSTANADSQGHWQWEAPENMVNGTYTIRAAVFDPTDLTRSGSAEASFIVEVLQEPVVPGEPINPGQGSPIPTPPASGEPSEPTLPPSEVPEGLLFGVFFNVLDDYKYVTVGEKVVGSLTIVNNAAIQTTDQAINYQIISPQGDVILETSDTVSFSKKAQFLKTFFTAPKTPTGDYTIKVSASYEGVKSVASDTFRLILPASSANSITPITQAPKNPVVVWALLILLLLLFVLLGLYAFYRARHHTKQMANSQPLTTAP